MSFRVHGLLLNCKSKFHRAVVLKSDAFRNVFKTHQNSANIKELKEKLDIFQKQLNSVKLNIRQGQNDVMEKMTSMKINISKSISDMIITSLKEPSQDQLNFQGRMTFCAIMIGVGSAATALATYVKLFMPKDDMSIRNH